MNFDDLLKLDINLDNINKIKDFIKGTSDVALNLKARILLSRFLYKLNLLNESLEALFSLIQDNEIINYNQLLIESYDLIIKIYLDNHDFEESNKYILKKKKILKNNIYLYNYDLINYYLKINDLDKAIKEITDITLLDIPDNIRFDILNKLIDIYLIKQDYHNALKIIESVFVDLSENAGIKYYKILYKYALVLFNLSDYSYVDRLESTDFLELELNGLKTILLLKTYQMLDNQKKCFLIESNFDLEIEKYNKLVQKSFFEACISLYNKYYNKDGIDYYTKRLEKIKIDEVLFVKQDLIKEELKQRAKKTVDKSKELYDIFALTNELLIKFNSVNIDDLKRNILLELGRILEGKISFKEIVLIINNEMYHYKKQRVYDKKLVPYTSTIFEPVFDSGNTLIIKSKLEMLPYNDIITNKSYIEEEVENAFIKPLKNNNSLIGAVAFIGNDLFINSSYELLDVFTNVLNLFLTHQSYFKNKLSDFNTYSYIFKNVDALIKFKQNDEIYLSSELAKILKTKDHIDELTYISKINTNYINYYKEFYNLNEVLKYKIGDKTYLEKIKTINEEIKISVLTDITNEESKFITEQNKVYTDYLTGLKNRFQLEKEFKIEKKMSLVVIDIYNFKEINYLYGSYKGDLILRALAENLKEIFDYKYVYKLTSDEFLIILDINDVRSVKNKLEEAFLIINQKIKKIDYRLDLYLLAGVIRFPTQKDEKRLDKLLHYATFAKRIAKEQAKPNKNQIQMFDMELYKKYKDEDITSAHIIEAINNDLIKVTYTPIINKQTRRLHQYFIAFEIDNYDIKHDEILRVAKLRNVIGNVENYLIKKATDSLKLVINEYKKYYNIMIPITKVDNELLEKLKKLSQKQEMLANALTLFLDDSTYIRDIRLLGIKVASKNINDLFNGIDYFICDYNDNLNSKSLDSLKSLCESLNTKLIITNTSEIDYKFELVKQNKSVSFQDVLKRIKR